MALIHVLRHEAGAFVGKMMQDRSLVDDVLQCATIKALQAFREGSFDRTKEVKPWYFQILHRVAIDVLRHEKRRSMLSLDDHGDDHSEGIGGYVSDDQCAPFQVMQQSERAEYVRLIVQGLSSSQMQAVQAVYFDGLTYAEAATMLDIEEKEIKSLLRRARKELRSIMEHHHKMTADDV